MSVFVEIKTLEFSYINGLFKENMIKCDKINRGQKMILKEIDKYLKCDFHMHSGSCYSRGYTNEEFIQKLKDVKNSLRPNHLKRLMRQFQMLFRLTVTHLMHGI